MSKKDSYKKTAQKNKANKNSMNQKNSIREAKIAELEASSGKKYKNPATSGWGKAIIVLLVLLMAGTGLITLLMILLSR